MAGLLLVATGLLLLRQALPVEPISSPPATGSVSARFLAPEDGEGEPLDVAVLPADGSPRAAAEARLVVTRRGEPARFVAPDLPPGSYRLVWSGANLAAGEKRFRVATGQRLDLGGLALATGITLEGSVVDAVGAPVPEASVEIQASPPRSFEIGDPRARRGAGRRLVGESDAVGRFRVVGVPLGEKLSFRASADGFVTVDRVWAGEGRLEIVLDPAERVFGEVVDLEGRSIGQATVDLSTRTEAGATKGGTRTTDDDGRFSLHRGESGEPDESGVTTVRISKNGYLAATIELDEPRTGSERDLGRVVLPRGRLLRGRVVAAGTREPLAGVHLSLFSDRHSDADAWAVTGADGTYEAAGIPPHVEVTAVARKDGYADATRELPEDAVVLDLALSRGGRLEGRVCASRSDLADLGVSLQPASGGRHRFLRTPDGLFAFESLEPGTYVLRRGWLTDEQGSAVRAGQASTMRVVVEEAKTSTAALGCHAIPVSGALLVNGRPLSSVQAFLHPQAEEIGAEIRTDASGRFEASVPIPGRYTATLSFLIDAEAVAAAPLGEADCQVPPSGTTSCVLDFPLAVK